MVINYHGVPQEKRKWESFGNIHTLMSAFKRTGGVMAIRVAQDFL
jgi:hypothetical protein